jgi:hypothetical protein
VGESSKGDDPKGGVVVYSRVVQDAKSCFRTMGVPFKGTEKGFLNFLTLVDEGHRSVSVPKQKGKREVKNLECSINFNARGVGSGQVRGKKLGVQSSLSSVFGFFRVFFLCFLFFFYFSVLVYSLYA